MSGADFVLALARVRALAVSGEAQRIRQAAGVSRAEIGRASGVTESAVYRWEKGERAPHGDAAIAYLNVLEALARSAAA